MATFAVVGVPGVRGASRTKSASIFTDAGARDGPSPASPWVVRAALIEVRTEVISVRGECTRDEPAVLSATQLAGASAGLHHQPDDGLVTDVVERLVDAERRVRSGACQGKGS